VPRKPHEPTEKARGEVRALAGYGVREDEIAVYMEMDPKTLRKHYRAELDSGHIRANVAVARSLYKQAVDDGNTAAAIFWLKARAGWRDRQELEISGVLKTQELPASVDEFV
jgi:hypothetical protein